MATLILKSPLDGWALTLDEIPDPVFAQGMAGDGIGIDPTGSVLHAPCDGQVSSVSKTRHAMSLRTTDGAELLLHLGIDSVTLDGAGFEPLVSVGDKVACGQPLLRFDLDLLVRGAPSAVTPIVVVGGAKVLRTASQCAVAVGDFIMEIDVDAVLAESNDAVGAGDTALTRSLVVGFEHGLHARPASRLVAALRPFTAKVSLRASGGSANARSAVALMALGVQCGEVVAVRALGVDASAALDAVASVLAPGVSTEPASPVPLLASAPSADLPARINAAIASRGLALGQVALLRHAAIDVDETAADPEHEIARLAAAIDAVLAQVIALADSRLDAQRSILEAHAQLVQDPELSDQAHRHIASGSSAGQGWRLAIATASQALDKLGDARMRERIADLHDIESQVLNVLAGRPPRTILALPDDAILIADELLPSQLIDLDSSRLAGICTARGGPTSHVAIIAAALGLPALVAAGPWVLALEPGRVVVLDAERGFLLTSPTASEIEAISVALATRRERQAADLAMSGSAAQTRDGQVVRVCANLGAANEALAAVARGADGCGLLRTELLYLQRHSPPSEDEQFEEYRQIRDRLAPRPLTIRTMDIGGDKPIPYLPLPAEDNPALGLRGIRTSLARPDLLRTQLRAILRLDSPASCRILLPMVTDAGDIRAVRAVLRECADELGISVLPKLGAMVETPASALLAEQLLLEADFLSIGTNDLSQYVLAMDRGHPVLAARLDALHPAVLRLIKAVASAGHACGRNVAVCGSLGSDPDAIALLVGLGINEVSAVPSAIPELKRIIRSLDAQACRKLAGQALQLADAAEVRKLVANGANTATNVEAGL